jgi:squalene synthase HpnC
VQSEGRYLSRRAGEENFPVAMRVLPAPVRRHLLALYDVARVIDDLGDVAAGDRTAALLDFRDDLATIWHGGTPRATVLRSLAPTVAACDLPEQLFADLIEANLRDQTTVQYATYEELLDYCRLSANPVGRLVLLIFGASTPDRVWLSDRVCTALQIIEHCQDVAEDHRAGRHYMPLEDLRQFAVAPADLGAARAPPAVRALHRYEAHRAGALLRDGAALVGDLRGWARLAVAGYVAGGLAALAALRRNGWSALPTHPHRRRRDVLAALVRLWFRPPGWAPRAKLLAAVRLEDV